jgi:hypothetical protein
VLVTWQAPIALELPPLLLPLPPPLLLPLPLPPPLLLLLPPPPPPLLPLEQANGAVNEATMTPKMIRLVMQSTSSR